MKNIFRYFLLIFIGLAFTQCLKSRLDDINLPAEEEVNVLESLVVPANFNFRTTQDVTINLIAPDFLHGAVFDIYHQNFLEGKIKLGSGAFSPGNSFSAFVSIPAYIDTIEIASRYFGLEQEVKLPILNGKAEYDYSVHFNAEREVEPKSANVPLKSAEVAGFSYMGTYTANGYPNYLHTVNDKAWESLLSNLNQTLPEGVSVPKTKPQFIAGSSQTNLVLKERSKVYVTFAGEGTPLESALGYFIYDGSKPADNKHIIIFPNASAPGSGGSLHSGDKVLLGEFPANTTIGWFLVPNGWSKKDRLVYDINGIYYSVPSFNPEGSSDLQNHMILLKDIQNEVIVLGFEDKRRDNGTSDNDFNDAVFYITLDNLNAADLTNVSATTSPVDTDGDGIIDILDAYPTDATLAFNNNTVSGNTGSIAFEDLWPSIGDFDFNDLVVDYKFNPITDASNLIKILEIQLTIRHIGASFHNGFAFELPVPASSVQSVTGAIFSKNYVNIASNGTESGVNNAIIFGFDDGWNVNGQTLTIQVKFTNAISSSSLGTFPFNPFMVVDGDRGREVHLADKPPTSKANSGLFGQNSDFSNPAQGRYYRTNNNLPWAINIAGPYAIPKEKASINKGHLKFVNWAESAGSQYPDWYLNISGYRDATYLY